MPVTLTRKETAMMFVPGYTWTQWSSWSQCDGSCPVGQMNRTRACVEMPNLNTATCGGVSEGIANCPVQCYSTIQGRACVFKHFNEMPGIDPRKPNNQRSCPFPFNHRSRVSFAQRRLKNCLQTS